VVKKMKALHIVTIILLVVGGINWGLFGAFNFNLVEKILTAGTLAKLVYILVGLSAVYEIATHKKTCKMCANDMSQAKPIM
jgi:uncharacterized membrane protein YuzA (DUF378 family)